MDFKLSKNKDDFYLKWLYEDLDEEYLEILNKFELRKNASIRKTSLPFIKIEQENTINALNEDKNCELYWDYFPINNQKFPQLSIQQNFMNIAIKVPSIMYPEINDKGIAKIFNSRNLLIPYEKIFEESGQNIDNMFLVFTKKFYLPNNFGANKFSENKMNQNKCYYIIPHINIYNNYYKINNKFICELTGTIIS